MEDDIHTFHISPWGLKYAHQLGHNGPGTLMVSCGQRQKASETSISYSLSLLELNNRITTVLLREYGQDQEDPP